jgi:hypothetical protein
VRFTKISNSKAKKWKWVQATKTPPSIKQTDTKNYEKKTQNREQSNVATSAIPENKRASKRSTLPRFGV